ncbi:MAG TPA: hypothetical protein PKD37_06980 [Oligoflexia bacterium]|nr:hypothetical protein [Oligoflexia bacterium]HMP27707.1 hypothetical protein [Oligoflexia bacterium]
MIFLKRADFGCILGAIIIMAIGSLCKSPIIFQDLNSLKLNQQLNFESLLALSLSPNPQQTRARDLILLPGITDRIALELENSPEFKKGDFTSLKIKGIGPKKRKFLEETFLSETANRFTGKSAAR